MAKNLVVVESPAKAKTLARYLGKDFVVKSSFGHIRDLPKKELGVDLAKNFKPDYQISEEKQKTADELKRAARRVTVWLASDEDREGEAIAWHVCQLLGLDPAKVKRIVFHEITEPAIAAAIKQPRNVDMKLVHAQQARRILDRLVGYELSPVLWKKVRTGLSAGRVQSVAVRLVVEREREIKDFKSESAFRISAVFDAAGHQLPAELPDRLKDIEKTRQLLKDAAKATFKVEKIEQKPGKRSPSAPFTTSTLQQEASRRLGFSVKQTMSLAQRLYESGHITYMRTDSTHISNLAVEAAKKHITGQYGEKYSQPTQYKTKTRSAQEAHEAIRPSNLAKTDKGGDASQKKLYNLIWRRAVASQMSPAAVMRTEATISNSRRPERFVAVGEVLQFDGFLKVYGKTKDDKLLPPLKEGQALKLKSMTALETPSRPPARYSEASLVKKLEELGIGRPSTYAPTISTIQAREYVEKRDLEGEAQSLRELNLAGGRLKETVQSVVVGADRGKLMPTQLAEIVTDFLVKHFSEIVDYDFTAKAEAELDDIAEGKLTWQQMLKEFYKQFHPLVEKSEKVSRAEVSQTRKLGKDPRSGKPVFARYGRFGPVLQLGESEPKKGKNSEKPRFAPLPEGAALDDVTLTQALPMFALPRVVGETAAKEPIEANIGRFGPYVKVGEEFYSIKDQDPLKISEKQARQVIAAKKRQQRNKVIADFDDIKILKGPFGPYVTDGKVNVKVPTKTDPKSITEKRARQMIKDQPEAKTNSRRARFRVKQT